MIYSFFVAAAFITTVCGISEVFRILPRDHEPSVLLRSASPSTSAIVGGWVGIPAPCRSGLEPGSQFANGTKVSIAPWNVTTTTNTTSFKVSVQINDVDSPQIVAAFLSSSDQFVVKLRLAQGNLSLIVQNDTLVAGSIDAKSFVGQWIELAVSVTQNTSASVQQLRWFVNCTTVIDSTVPLVVPQTIARATLGGVFEDVAERDFNGCMHNFVVYDDVLSSAMCSSLNETYSPRRVTPTDADRSAVVFFFDATAPAGQKNQMRQLDFDSAGTVVRETPNITFETDLVLREMAFGPDGLLYYCRIASPSSQSGVFRVNASLPNTTSTMVLPQSLCGNPHGLVFIATRMYVSCLAGYVVAVDLRTLSVVAQTPGGAVVWPTAVVLHSSRRLLMVSSHMQFRIAFFTLPDLKAVKSAISLAPQPPSWQTFVPELGLQALFAGDNFTLYNVTAQRQVWSNDAINVTTFALNALAVLADGTVFFPFSFANTSDGMPDKLIKPLFWNVLTPLHTVTPLNLSGMGNVGVGACVRSCPLCNTNPVTKRPVCMYPLTTLPTTIATTAAASTSGTSATSATSTGNSKITSTAANMQSSTVTSSAAPTGSTVPGAATQKTVGGASDNGTQSVVNDGAIDPTFIGAAVAVGIAAIIITIIITSLICIARNRKQLQAARLNQPPQHDGAYDVAPVQRSSEYVSTSTLATPTDVYGAAPVLARSDTNYSDAPPEKMYMGPPLST